MTSAQADSHVDTKLQALGDSVQALAQQVASYIELREGSTSALENSVQAVTQQVRSCMESRDISTSMAEELGLQGGFDAASGREESEEEGASKQDAEGQSVKTVEENSTDEGLSSPEVGGESGGASSPSSSDCSRRRAVGR